MLSDKCHECGKVIGTTATVSRRIGPFRFCSEPCMDKYKTMPAREHPSNVPISSSVGYYEQGGTRPKDRTTVDVEPSMPFGDALGRAIDGNPGRAWWGR